VKAKPSKKRPFNINVYLRRPGVSKQILTFKKSQHLFSQGEPCTTVLYIQSGAVKLTVLNEHGKEAVIALLGAGDFLGESCISGGSPVRLATATAMAPTIALAIQKKEMLRILRGEKEFTEYFLAYMLKRNLRIEADLVDQLFNSSEKRLARALLILARYGTEGQPDPVLGKISQETLAELIGASRPRVSSLMNKFRKLGFIQYDGGLHVHSSLLNVVLHG
jgi:CRP/FNR family cyclic AMP-dependent transcriptional regulator